MSQSLETIEFVPDRSVQEQIHRHVRGLIVSGVLAPGERLPSTQQLAKLWNAQTRTVQLALAPLARQGWLSRVNRVGTFVRQREQKLTAVAVLGGVSVSESLYWQALHKALQVELQQAGIEMTLWMDPRPDEQSAEPWQAFVDAVARREFQAVIVTNSSTNQLHWQTKLSVPVAFQVGPHFPNSAGWDLKQLAELSVRVLAQQGCRSMGLVSRVLRSELYECLLDQAAAHGVRVKNKWMRVPTAGMDWGGGVAQERFGHEEFLRLWAQRERPEGLIVFPDTVVRGVVLGLMEKQVRVPAELKLVLHKNEAVDLYCPLPATLLVSSERKLARALIAQVQKQFRGERTEHILLPFDMVSNAGS